MSQIFPNSYSPFNPGLNQTAQWLNGSSPKFVAKQVEQTQKALEENANKITNNWQAGAEELSKITKFNKELGFSNDFIVESPSVSEGGVGSLANVIKPRGNGLKDVVKQYPWTISNSFLKSDVPYIQLKEHEITGGQIMTQVNFYALGVFQTSKDLINKAINSGGESADVLDVYKEIFPRNPTGFRYKFPYFAKAYYELNTPTWQQFDKIGTSLGQITSGTKQASKSLGGRARILEEAVDIASAIGGFASQAAITGLQAIYPSVGISDRPRIFTSHTERTVNIEFPLFNTVSSGAWLRNKDLIHLLAWQNLFNKRNFITGTPPVWYEVYVPGTYYSVASCVTQLKVENLGNTRLMNHGGINFVVPDAYQVSISLTEMAQPSRNQFQAAQSTLGYERVTATSKADETKEKELNAIAEAKRQVAEANEKEITDTRQNTFGNKETPSTVNSYAGRQSIGGNPLIFGGM